MASEPKVMVKSLIDLPNELLDSIALHLDQASLCSLARTCKKTTSSAIDSLYKSYDNNKPMKSLAPFLRTIARRPTLAEKVKTVRIRGWRSEAEVATSVILLDGEIYTMPDLSSSQRRQDYRPFARAAFHAGIIPSFQSKPATPLRQECVKHTIMEADDDFARLLAHGVEDAHALLMLALLPNLQDLQVLGLKPCPILNWFHFLSRSDSALRKIEKITLTGCEKNLDRFPVVIHDLNFLRLCPSLQVLRLSNIGGRDSDLNSSLLSMNLQEMRFIDCAFHIPLLKKLLAGQRLRTFVYRPGCPQALTVGDTDFCSADIIPYLKFSRDSLEILYLFPNVHDLDECCQLAQFTNLRDVTMPQPGFLPARPDDEWGDKVENCNARLFIICKQMPRSLTHLSLDYLLYDYDTIVWLELLAHCKSVGAFPAFKALTLNFPTSRPDGVDFDRLPDIVEKVQERHERSFRDVGVKLTVTQK